MGAMPRGAHNSSFSAGAVDCVCSAWIAGAETLELFGGTLRTLAVGLVDEMVDVVVCAPSPGGQGRRYAWPHELLAYDAPRWWRPWRATAGALAETLRVRKPDVLVALDGSVAGLTRAVSDATGLACLLSCSSLGDVRRVREAAGHGTVVLAASEPIRAALVAQGGCDREKVHVMRPGVYHVAKPGCFRDGGRSVAIIAGGDMDDFAAFEAVLLSFAELVARRYDGVFFLVGTGRAERRLRRRAEQLGLLGQLTFTDCRPLEQLSGVLKAADVYIAPARTAGLDIRPLLAMAAGVPVLAAAKAGADDFLHEGETAVLFERANAAELTVHLANLLDEPDSARALADSALDYVHRNHSPAVNVTAMAHFCRQAVRARSGV